MIFEILDFFVIFINKSYRTFSDSIANFSIFYIKFHTFFFSISRQFRFDDLFPNETFWLLTFFLLFCYLIDFSLLFGLFYHLCCPIIFVCFSFPSKSHSVQKSQIFSIVWFFFFYRENRIFLAQKLIFNSFNFRANIQIFLVRKFKHFSVWAQKFKFPNQDFHQKKRNDFLDKKKCVFLIIKMLKKYVY